MWTWYARNRERVELVITVVLTIAAAVVWAAVAVHAFGLSFMPDVVTFAGNWLAAGLMGGVE